MLGLGLMNENHKIPDQQHVAPLPKNGESLGEMMFSIHFVTLPSSKVILTCAVGQVQIIPQVASGVGLNQGSKLKGRIDWDGNLL